MLNLSILSKFNLSLTMEIKNYKKKNLIVNFYISIKILETEFSVAKGHPILPANVPVIKLRRKIQLFQFPSLIPFLIPFLFSRHLLLPTISDGVLFCFKIL